MAATKVSLADIQHHLDQLQQTVDQYRQQGIAHIDERQCVGLAQQANELRMLTNPVASVGMEIAMMPYITTAVRLAIELQIFRALATKSPLTAQQLSQYAAAARPPNGSVVESSFIVRIMRLISLYGLVVEFAPSTYAANQHTSAFGQLGSPLESLIGHTFDFYMPVLHHSIPYFAAHGYAFPDQPHAGPFQSFYHTDKATYDYWLDQPPHILQRLNNFMSVLHSQPWYEWMDAPGLIRTHLRAHSRADSPLNAAAADSPVHHSPLLVDVGGGKGLAIHSLRQQLDAAGIDGEVHLQDRADVLPDALATAKDVCGRTDGMPGVRYIAHDFFTPQPARSRGALFYFLQHILHNWNDADSLTILRHVASGMRPGYSRLLINERILKPTGNDLFTASLDFHMALSHAARERSLEEYDRFARQAGLTIVKCWQSPDQGEDVLECMLA